MAKLYIKKLETGETIREVSVGNKSEKQVEQIMKGMLRNMNTDEYYIDDSEIASTPGENSKK